MDIVSLSSIAQYYILYFYMTFIVLISLVRRLKERFTDFYQQNYVPLAQSAEFINAEYLSYHQKDHHINIWTPSSIGAPTTYCINHLVLDAIFFEYIYVD